MNKASHFSYYLHFTFLLVFVTFLSGTMFGQIDPYDWDRLPTDAEINSAKENLIKELTQTISVNGKVVDQKNVRLTPLIKMHVKSKVGQLPPEDISRLIVWVEVTGVMGGKSGEYNLFQNKQTGKFGFARHADYIGSIDERYSNMISYLDSYPNNDSGLARGFAPSTGGASAPVNNNTSSVNQSTPSEDDEIPWEVVIGGSIAAAVAAIIRKILKKGAASKTSKTSKNKKEQKEEEEEAHYILQLNKNSFQLKLNEPETLEVQVWKVTAKGEKRCSANIQIQNFEKALKITPTTGVNSLQAQLVLEKQPKETSFTILVNANAEGHEFQKEVTIQPFGELQIVVETSPDNKRTLRPDTFQIITCYAQVLDELGKNIPDLTKKIQFTPKSDWIDISQSIIDGDRIAINIGCSNPNPISAASHPPKSVILSVTMDDVPDDVEPLQLDVEIQLLDCSLETEINDATFPATDELNEITFNAYIENAGEEIGWNFVGEYKIGDEPTDPLTTISIDKKNETEVSVKLSGPLIKPSENETFISKTLVISVFQNDEKPLERHLNIIVSREGLFIKHGVNKNNELNFTADKPFEQNLEFALNVYDETPIKL